METNYQRLIFNEQEIHLNEQNRGGVGCPMFDVTSKLIDVHRLIIDVYRLIIDVTSIEIDVISWLHQLFTS